MEVEIMGGIKTKTNPLGRGFAPKWDDAIRRYILSENSHGRPVSTAQILKRFGMHRNTALDSLNRIEAKSFWVTGGPTGGIKKLWYLGQNRPATPKNLVLARKLIRPNEAADRVLAALRAFNEPTSTMTLSRVTKTPRTTVVAALYRIGAVFEWDSSHFLNRRKLWRLPAGYCERVPGADADADADDEGDVESVQELVEVDPEPEPEPEPELEDDWRDTEFTSLLRPAYEPPSLSIRLLEREQCARAALMRLPPERRTPETLEIIRALLTQEDRELRISCGGV